MKQTNNDLDGKIKLHDITAELISGGASGTAAQIITYPIETVKTIYQSNSHQTYLGITKEIYKNGISKFWKGVLVPSSTFGVVNAVSFCSYYSIRHTYTENELTDGNIVMAAGISGVIQLIPWIPSEVIKIQMQKDAHLPKSDKVTIMSCIKSIYKKHGFKGFYYGGLAQASRDVPNNIIYFYVYEKISSFCRLHIDVNTMLRAFISGGITGTVSWVVVIPFDLYKTRRQTREDKSLKEFLTRVLHADSRISLFRGSVASTVRSFIVNGIIFVLYEQLYPFLKDL